jgi:hypothetical protein
MIISSGIRVGAGVSIIPENNITYTAGLFKTTYAGYFADVPSFFATATPTMVVLTLFKKEVELFH